MWRPTRPYPFLARLAEAVPRFPRVRAWFAKDRGRTTVDELLNLVPARG